MDYCLDADRIWASDGYGATIYQLSDEKRETEGPSLPFGFVNEQRANRLARNPEPWMWWNDAVAEG